MLYNSITKKNLMKIDLTPQETGLILGMIKQVSFKGEVLEAALSLKTKIEDLAKQFADQERVSEPIVEAEIVETSKDEPKLEEKTSENPS